MPSRRRPPVKRHREPLVYYARGLDSVSDLCRLYSDVCAAIDATSSGLQRGGEGQATTLRAARASLVTLRKQLEPAVRQRIATLKGRGVDRVVHEMVDAFMRANDQTKSLRTLTPRRKIPRALLKP